MNKNKLISLNNNFTKSLDEYSDILAFFSFSKSNNSAEKIFYKIKKQLEKICNEIDKRTKIFEEKNINDERQLFQYGGSTFLYSIVILMEQLTLFYLIRQLIKEYSSLEDNTALFNKLKIFFPEDFDFNNPESVNQKQLDLYLKEPVQKIINALNLDNKYSREIKAIKTDIKNFYDSQLDVIRLTESFWTQESIKERGQEFKNEVFKILRENLDNEVLIKENSVIYEQMLNYLDSFLNKCFKL